MSNLVCPINSILGNPDAYFLFRLTSAALACVESRAQSTKVRGSGQARGGSALSRERSDHRK